MTRIRTIVAAKIHSVRSRNKLRDPTRPLSGPENIIYYPLLHVSVRNKIGDQLKADFRDDK
jgi:hypothetical protein